MYYYVTVNKQIGHNAQKRLKNMAFLLHHNPGVQSSFLVWKGRSISKNKCEAYCCYRSWATALQSLPTRTTSEPSQYFEQTSAVPPANFKSTAREPFVGIINTNLQAVAALSELLSVNCTHSEVVLAKRTTHAKPWRGWMYIQCLAAV